jgi:diamine N-acetyltransferase
LPPSPTFRRATVDDATALADLAATAFWDTYREIDDPEDLADYIAEHFRPEAMAAAIADPAAITLLVEIGAELAGYAVLQRAPAPPCVEGPAPIELARLYLDKAHIGRGLGDQLMHAVRAEAQRLGAKTLWLGVYDRNLRAVRFYERCGFVKAGGKEFLFGGKVYIDPIYAAPVSGGA